jgi:hypothetical protein
VGALGRGLLLPPLQLGQVAHVVDEGGGLAARPRPRAGRRARRCRRCSAARCGGSPPSPRS